MEGYTKIPLGFDQIRIKIVWNEDSTLLKLRTVTKLNASSMSHREK